MTKVLLVDDSKFSCKREAEMLKEFNPNFEIDLVYLPSAAIEMVHEKKHGYALLFLDFNMPEMNGLELAERLKEDIHNSQVILLTATSAFATKAQTLPEGMRLIQKPLSLEKLKECLTDEEAKL